MYSEMISPIYDIRTFNVHYNSVLFSIKEDFIGFQIAALHPIESSGRPYVDLDPIFGSANDEDFDITLMVNFQIRTK